MNKGIDRDSIVNMYINDKMSLPEISKIVNLKPGSIRSLLITRKIKLRSVKESLELKYPDGRNGKLSANWKGGLRKTGGGYIYCYSPKHPFRTKEGYVMEHRLVVEEAYKRYLSKEEIVHHKNGIKTDNRLENLEIISSCGQHTREHFQKSFKYDVLLKQNEALKAKIKELEDTIQIRFS